MFIMDLDSINLGTGEYVHGVIATNSAVEENGVDKFLRN